MREQSKPRAITIRWTQASYDAVVAAARQDQRDVSDWIRVVVRRALEEGARQQHHNRAS